MKHLLTSLLLPLALLASDPILVTVDENAVHFRVEGKGGMYPKPLPARVTIPEGATTAWEGETLTLTVTVETPAAVEGDPPTITVTPFVLTPQEIADAWAFVPPPPVPERVTKAQLKIALIQSGIDLDALVASLPSEQQPIARILVDDADFFQRSAGMVNTLGAAAGLTPEQIDDLFRAAGAIDPASL